MAYTKPQTLDASPSGDTVKTAIVSKLDVNATQIVSDLNTHEALTETHGATGAVVGTTNIQTLTNKTLTAPTITGAGAIAGVFTGNITGNVTGNVTGDVTGNVTGDVTGNADTATLAASATKLATARAINGVDFDGTAAITIIPRITTITSSATPTINTDNCDAVTITALATAITSMTSGLSGTPVNFQKLIIRIKDDGTARAISWGASFEAKGVSLPTTTVISKVLTVGFIYDTVTSKWGCVAAVQEA